MKAPPTGVLHPTAEVTRMAKNLNVNLKTEIWLGDEVAHELLLQAKQKVENAPEEMKQRAAAYDAEEKPSHWMTDVQGNVATISIVGPMEQGRAGIWGFWFGYVGYDDIKEAINSGIEQGATSFILDWDTPGGTVAGIEDASQFLKDLAEEFDTVSFTSNMAASGGLWLATSVDAFYATPMAQIGSLGVIAVHTEVKDMLDEMGITKTVFRSAPNKALGSPYEKLTEKAKQKIEADIAKTHEFFVDAITENTGMARDYVAKEIATGDVWYGQEALDKGLIDGVKTYKEVFIALSEESEENTSNYPNSLGVDMKKKRISEQAAAAIASGVPVDVALENEEVIDEGDEEENTGGDEGDQTDPVEDEVDDESKSDASAGDSLTAALMALTTELGDTKAKLALAETKLTQVASDTDSMKSIVVKTIQRGQVALGSTPTDTETLMGFDAGVLVQQHAQVDAQLSKRFPVGGRVSDQVDESSDEDKSMQAVVRHNEQVMLDLATFKKSK